MNIMRFGFVVNPVAGMGGKVGLKGTDNILKEAVENGAQPVSPQRAITFLRELKQLMGNWSIELICCPGIMGETEANSAAVPFQVIPININEETTAKDTQKAVNFLIKSEVSLIIFVGGDGTARDILDALKEYRNIPVLGVPAGVKMYSGLFAVSPQDAAEAAIAFAEKRAETMDFEVMDADETAIRSDVFSVKLHGYLKGIYIPQLIQGSKEISPDTENEEENQAAIARYIAEELPTDAAIILGPGTTLEKVAKQLGVEKTVLGVDIYQKRKLTKDANEKKLLKIIKNWQKTWLILSPIGHQGILLGRGNQQLSPKIIKLLGKKHIIVVATRNKLRSINGKALRVDTGDPEVDASLRGKIRVIIDYKIAVQIPVH
jgi:predicted polyphosphate/ATP-dependent NAD kinase